MIKIPLKDIVIWNQVSVIGYPFLFNNSFFAPVIGANIMPNTEWWIPNDVSVGYDIDFSYIFISDISFMKCSYVLDGVENENILIGEDPGYDKNDPNVSLWYNFKYEVVGGRLFGVNLPISFFYKAGYEFLLIPDNHKQLMAPGRWLFEKPHEDSEFDGFIDPLVARDFLVNKNLPTEIKELLLVM